MATKRMKFVKVTAPLARIIDAMLPNHSWFSAERSARNFNEGFVRPYLIEPVVLEIVLPFTGRRVRCQVWVLTRRAGARS